MGIKLTPDLRRQLEAQGHIPPRRRERRERKARAKPQPLVGPPQSWSITIPGYTFPSLNDLIRSHWRVKHKLKKEAAQMVGLYGRHVEKATTKRRVLLTLVRDRTQRERDADNCKKVCLDALVAAGLLGGDDPAWVECPDPVQLVGEVRETRIEIEEV